jgi:hypothetical protein
MPQLCQRWAALAAVVSCGADDGRMGTHNRPTSRAAGARAAGTGGRCPDRPLSVPPSPELPIEIEVSPAAGQLPPLPPASPSGPVAELPPVPDAPSWSPLRVALALFGAVWICFAGLAVHATAPPAADLARLAHLLATGVAVVALVLITLSVAHAQVSGLSPRPAVVATVAVGVGQAVVATAIGSGLWDVAARVFELVAVTVPLAWVGGQFQSGVRRHRAERRNSLIVSWTARARQQAHETVDSVHRHDLRSMLFVIDGASRALADGTLNDEQRASFTEMLAEGLQRLAALTEVRSEGIAPFAAAELVRAVALGERRAGRSLTVDVPAEITAVGRAADVAAVLRTLAAVTGKEGATGVQVRGELDAGAVVLSVEPAGADVLPLLVRNWEQIRVESFKTLTAADEEGVDLFVAARLLADQGADLWSTAGRARFAVRLPALPDSSSEEPA